MTLALLRQECRIWRACKAENIPSICRHTRVSMEQIWRLCIGTWNHLNLQTCCLRAATVLVAFVAGHKQIFQTCPNVLNHGQCSWACFDPYVEKPLDLGHVMPCSITCFLCFWFSFRRLSMTRHIGEAKDEEHRKKLEDLLKDLISLIPLARGLFCFTSIPSRDYSYVAISVEAAL